MTDRPTCACHGAPKWGSRCSVSETERNARRVRMNAGGIQFFAGRAPTSADALTLRTKIKREAPHGTVRIA